MVIFPNQEYSVPEVKKPRIDWQCKNGALLHCHDGTTHFLTLLEKMLLRIGSTSVEELDRQYNNDDQKG